MIKYGKLDKPVFNREDARGIFSELINFGEWQSLIVGTMKKGAELGHHYHKYTVNFYHLLSGKADIKTLNIKTGKKRKAWLSAGQAYIFRPEEVRVIRHTEDSKFLMMKSHRYDPKNPDLIDYKDDF